MKVNQGVLTVACTEIEAMYLASTGANLDNFMERASLWVVKSNVLSRAAGIDATMAREVKSSAPLRCNKSALKEYL